MSIETKLLSGVPATVRGFTGKEQRLLTESTGKQTERIYKVLKSVTLTVGDVDLSTLTEEARDKFFLDMLTCDKKKLLVAARAATFSDPEFLFTFEYKDINGVDKSEVKTVDLSDGFPEYNVKVYDSKLIEGKSFKELYLTAEEVRQKAEDMACENYAQVVANSRMVIKAPSGTLYRVTMANGMGEQAIAAQGKKDLSSHSSLIMRNICKVIGDTPDSVIRMTLSDLDKAPLDDLDYIRIVVKIFEGRVDTELKFEHPDADFKPVKEKDVVVDLVNEMAFFFRSETV